MDGEWRDQELGPVEGWRRGNGVCLSSVLRGHGKGKEEEPRDGEGKTQRWGERRRQRRRREGGGDKTAGVIEEKGESKEERRRKKRQERGEDRRNKRRK